MQARVLEAGEAFAGGALLGAAGVRAAWAALMPDEGVAWFRRQTWTDAQLASLGAQWAGVWWHYLAATVGADGDAVLCLAAPAARVVRVADAGAALVRAQPAARAAFAAVLFQLAVTARHDQHVCAVTADPARPPFYGHYVTRTRPASLFSLRSLLEAEADFACARRTTDAFRGVRGKVVAEFKGADGTLIRRPRDKIRRFKCHRCVALAERRRPPRPRCPHCTRLQEHHPEGLVHYYSNQHAWVPVPDALTVCGDVVFEQARGLKAGARLTHHGRTCVVHKLTRGRDGEDVKVHLRHLDDDGAAFTVRCAPKSVFAVLPAAPDCARMLRETPRIVHGMCLSVDVDKLWRRRAAGAVPALERAPLALNPRDPQDLRAYAVWRSLAAVARWASGAPAWDAARGHSLRPAATTASL
jgi:hypothetical protein